MPFVVTGYGCCCLAIGYTPHPLPDCSYTADTVTVTPLQVTFTTTFTVDPPPPFPTRLPVGRIPDSVEIPITDYGYLLHGCSDLVTLFVATPCAVGWTTPLQFGTPTCRYCYRCPAARFPVTATAAAQLLTYTALRVRMAFAVRWLNVTLPLPSSRLPATDYCTTLCRLPDYCTRALPVGRRLRRLLVARFCQRLTAILPAPLAEPGHT